MTLAPELSVLAPVGPQAERLHALWRLFLGVSVGVMVLVVGVQLWAIGRGVRRRRRLGEGDPLQIDVAQSRRMVRAIAVATALTVVVLFGLLFVSVSTGQAMSAAHSEGEDALTIEITGHQWWWEIRYPHATPQGYFTTANEIHVPTGRWVRLVLRSSDVIHSLWIPNVHGKTDLVPGRTNVTWIRVDEPGTHRGQCAEFCGLQHANMAVVLVAQAPREFEAWAAGQRTLAVAPTVDSIRRGERIFMEGPCATCHTVVGTPAGGRAGPDLTHVASRSTLAAGKLPNTRDNLADWITDPAGIKPGVRMPANPMPRADLDALLDYLESLK